MWKSFCCLLALLPLYATAQGESNSGDFLRRNDTPPIIMQCEDSAADCTVRHLNAFVNEHLYYPWEDRAKKIKGSAVVQFTIDEQGQMKNSKCLKAPTPAMVRKAEYLMWRIKMHFDWKPGQRQDEAVKALYYLPITFDPDRHPLGAPPPPPPKEEEIFKVVAEMPRFPGCEGLPKAERKDCADLKLLAFLCEYGKYPEPALKAKASARVDIQFIIDRDGSVTRVKALNDPGLGFAEAAVEVVDLIRKKGIKWHTGSSRFRPVKVQFVVPVRFSYDKTGNGISPE